MDIPANSETAGLRIERDAAEGVREFSGVRDLHDGTGDGSYGGLWGKNPPTIGSERVPEEAEERFLSRASFDDVGVLLPELRDRLPCD